MIHAGQLNGLPAGETPSRSDAVKITLSDEAKQMMAARGAGEPPPVQLPEILVSATRADGNAWKAKLPAFKPWTEETERQYQGYMSGLQAMAERAFNLVTSSFKTDGIDLNNPDHMAAYKEALDALLKTAYVAMKNPNAFVDGPGADDFAANDLLTALRNTDIVLTGSSEHPWSIYYQSRHQQGAHHAVGNCDQNNNAERKFHYSSQHFSVPRVGPRDGWGASRSGHDVGRIPDRKSHFVGTGP